MSTALTDGHAHAGLAASEVPAALVRDFLSALEQEEAKLLTWGVVDGGFTLEDVNERARAFLDDREDTGEVEPASLVDAMIGRRLLFDFPRDPLAGPAANPPSDDEGYIYRTRMAESVRLFARLRRG
jgi:hypothetical protein